MGLRVNNSSGVLSTLRSLQQSLLGLRRAQEAQSTGLAINRASQNPAGLVISEILRSEIGSIEQAVENTGRATNLVNTAEGALQEISNQLVNLRSNAIRALNTGGLPDEALAAVQDQVDRAVGAIDRIAGTTRFGREPLINGEQAFTLSGVPTQLTNVQIQQLDLANAPVQIDVQVTAAATRAQAVGALGGVQNRAVVRISGELGTATVEIRSGASVAEREEAINSVRDFTGVTATGGLIQSAEVGSEAFVQIEELEGDLAGITPGRDQGTDIVGTIEGGNAVGRRNTLSRNDITFRGDVAVQQGVTGTFSFNVTGGGATFQIGGEPRAAERVQIGIPALDASRLGATSTLGSLASIQAGGENSVLTNPANAVRIIDSAINEVNDVRGNLGALVADVFEPNARSLGVRIENLTASESEVRDADFALEVARAVRNQVLSQAGIRVLGQQNQLGRGVLDLLRG